MSRPDVSWTRRRRWDGVVRLLFGLDHLSEPYFTPGRVSFVGEDGDEIVFYPDREGSLVREDGDEIVVRLP